MAQDLNRSGAVGDASKATADAGANILDAAAQSLVDLIAEIGAFDLKAFAEESSEPWCFYGAVLTRSTSGTIKTV